MRLSRIILDGFKSFGSYTQVSFAPALTAIVGPNGCGKSNLLDAVLWACGSRRWKSLRGAEMEDVIFSGTDQLPPAERAHVRATFDNADERLGFAASEVEITREIFRGGASESQLCGTPVRLKDVAAVVAGTGLGDDGFAFIRQGQIDRVILSGGEELHKALEEAAGIARYRMRREEARAKLLNVDHDLAEMKRRVDRSRSEMRKVKEKAAQAKKKRELESRLEKLRMVLLAHEAWTLREEVTRLTERLASVNAREAEADRHRKQALCERARMEEQLQNVESPRESAPAAPVLIDQDEASKAASMIEEEGRRLISASRKLVEDGPPAWTEVRRDVEASIERLRAVAGGRAPSVRPASKSVSGAARNLREINRMIDEAAETLRLLAVEAATLKEKCGRARARLTELDASTAFEAEPPKDIESVAVEARQLEVEILSIGPVDETAPGRESELEAEIKKLVTQRGDIDAARARLSLFISEVDLHAGNLYAKAMERTARAFQKNLERLFGGGAASLRPLAEQRVAVSVKLPGKKECELSLLSGGEKSLSGIALVLALSEAAGEKKGGGVLILDEVDAPLDEANAVRYAGLVGSMARENQVLCCTHNVRTMEMADRILGVTTTQVGLSTVIEVRLDRQGHKLQSAELERTRAGS